MSELDLLRGDPSIPEDLTELLTPIDGGFHVKMREDGEACIDVLRMLYNWRIVRSVRRPHLPVHQVVDGAWCYYGHGEDERGNPRTMGTALVCAVLAAHAWDGQGEPPGYDKRAGHA